LGLSQRCEAAIANYSQLQGLCCDEIDNHHSVDFAAVKAYAACNLRTGKECGHEGDNLA
jgi:hypothetical protein